MDVRKVKKLIELLEESSISEIEIHEGEESVRVSRASPAAVVPFLLSLQTQKELGNPKLSGGDFHCNPFARG